MNVHSLTNMSDPELLARWCTGDRRAADLLVRRHLAALAAFIRRKVPESSEDLTQRLFYCVCRAKHGFRGGSSVRTWLFQITRNLVIDERRRSLRDPDADAVSKLAAPGPSPEEREQHAGDALRLAAALRTLPVDEQRVLALHYWHDRNHREVAATLAIPLGTVKSRVLQARRRLAELLRERTAVPAQGRIEQWLAGLDLAIEPGTGPAHPARGV